MIMKPSLEADKFTTPKSRWNVKNLKHLLGFALLYSAYALALPSAFIGYADVGRQIWRSMNISFRIIAATFALASVTACTKYSGDSLLNLPEQASVYDQSSIISKAKSDVSDIFDNLGISEEANNSLRNISPKSVIRDSEPLKLTQVDNQLVVVGADTNIAFATNSIIISTGAVHIAHSSNSVVVCGSDVDISHDGSLGNGSLVISKGKAKISHAENTLIYAINGVEISHANNVRAYNTNERKTSWGHINNNLVKLLFHEETKSNPSVHTGAVQ